MSFDNTELAWNSVDVRGDDGLLHNGRVIDAVADGLVVHFGGTGYSGPHTIPFGHIYPRDHQYLRRVGVQFYDVDDIETHETFANKRQKDMHKPGPVDVLLRLQPTDRWKWYPGTLLDALGLVSVILPDREIKGFVRQERIEGKRSASYLAYVQVQKYLFRDGAVFWHDVVAVPSQVDASRASDDQLIAMFNAHCRQQHYWMMATEVLKKVNERQELSRELVVLGIYDESKDDLSGIPVRNMLRNMCEEPLEELLLSLFNNGTDSLGTTPSVSAPCPDGDIRSLYRAGTIFPLIFECLTTFQQTKLRAVCRQWDAILISASIRRVVSFSPPCYGPNYTRDLYGFASSMQNCWTQQARVLVLYGGNRPGACENGLHRTAQFLQRVMTEKGLPAVEMLLLSGAWHCRFGFTVPNWMIAFSEVFISLAGLCQQVVLKDVGVDVALTRSQQYDEDEEDEEESIIVRFSHLTVAGQLTAAYFWAMIDNGLSELSAQDMERLAEWISSDSVPAPDDWESPQAQEKIVQIINTTQTMDPRNGIRYRGMAFKVTDLSGVDVRHLTKLTLYALLQYFEDPEDYNIVIHVR